jgi:cobalamin biosynthesis Mg chelatase CobN
MTNDQCIVEARASLAQAGQSVHEALERLVDAEVRPDLWEPLSAVLDAIADAYFSLVNAPSDHDCDTTTQF